MEESGEVEQDYRVLRHRMVVSQLQARGVKSPEVLAAMGEVPRHLFVPAALRALAYEDRPLPIECEQTISQPLIVAKMTELALSGAASSGLALSDLVLPRTEERPKVLEVGSGSGYQAAILAACGAEVFSIEIIAPLAEVAARNLAGSRYGDAIHLRVGDGYRGWPEEAPFDAIVVTAAPAHIPQPLVQQLKQGGRLVIPVGDSEQDMLIVDKHAEGVISRSLFPVRFVPMTGEAERDPIKPV